MDASVDFPAPFGPSSPRTSPACTDNDTPASAVWSPYRLTTSVTASTVAALQRRTRYQDTMSYLGVKCRIYVREWQRMPVEKWTPERRRQRTRDALLDAASKVFAERGFQGASLDEIAATAGYTRGAIYKHFADKEELLHEVCVRLNERTFAEFDEIPADHDWRDMDIDAVTDQWTSMTERDAEFRVVMLEFQLHAYRNPQLRERAREFARANRRAIADYLTKRADEAGEPMPVDVEQLASVFGTSSDGFAQMALFDPDAADHYGLLLDLVMRGLRSLAEDAAPNSPLASPPVTSSPVLASLRPRRLRSAGALVAERRGVRVHADRHVGCAIGEPMGVGGRGARRRAGRVHRGHRTVSSDVRSRSPAGRHGRRASRRPSRRGRGSRRMRSDPTP